MLGNDIIDLHKAKAESNWKRHGYLSKVFNAEEQEEILNSDYPDLLVWLFWSMKEATYKIINRERLTRFYSPTKFSCKRNGKDCYVTFGSNIYYTNSVITENFIHTIASTQKKNLARIQTYYSQYKPNYVFEFNTKYAHYFIEKNANGIPYLVNKARGKSDTLSISHHGSYLAISAHLLLQKLTR